MLYMDDMTEAARIRAWREYRELSQSECAHAIGVTRAAWSNWETQGTDPTLSNLRAIVRLFRLTMVRFYGRIPRKGGRERRAA